MEIDLSWLESAFREKEGIKRVVSIDREKGLPEGNNFGSEICRLSIQLETSTGQVITMPGIVKTLPPNQELTDFLHEHYVFQREINVSSQVYFHQNFFLRKPGHSPIFVPFRCLNMYSPKWRKLFRSMARDVWTLYGPYALLTGNMTTLHWRTSRYKFI
jgi:hypothetical protein